MVDQKFVLLTTPEVRAYEHGCKTKLFRMRTANDFSQVLAFGCLGITWAPNPKGLRSGSFQGRHSLQISFWCPKPIKDIRALQQLPDFVRRRPRLQRSRRSASPNEVGAQNGGALCDGAIQTVGSPLVSLCTNNKTGTFKS